MENNNNLMGGFAISLNNLADAMKFCEMMSESELCPDAYKASTFLNKICGQDQDAKQLPENIEKARRMSINNIFIACSYGASLHLNPFQSLQGIGIVNGKPSIYGDTLVGLILPLCKDFNEFFDTKTGTAVCQIVRKGTNRTVQGTFSWEDAKRAGLAGKKGPWSQYPQRMLQMRARGFAIRDAFPDLLSGIITREEAEDYPSQSSQQTQQAQPQPQQIQAQPQSVIAQNATTTQIETVTVNQ